MYVDKCRLPGMAHYNKLDTRCIKGRSQMTSQAFGFSQRRACDASRAEPIPVQNTQTSSLELMEAESPHRIQ